LAGNHDNLYDTTANWTLYDKYINYARFSSTSWWGGSNDSTTARHYYDLVDVGNEKFIIFHFSYTASTYNDIPWAWANTTLQTYSDRHAIITTHAGMACDGSYEYLGSNITNGLALPNPNVFLIMFGHRHCEQYKNVTSGAHTVHLYLANFQELWCPGGSNQTGCGYMSIMRFIPDLDLLEFRTFSPWLGIYNNSVLDGDGNRNISFAMDNTTSTSNTTLIGTAVNVANNTVATVNFTGLEVYKNYTWFANITDGTNVTTTGNYTFGVESISPAISWVNITPVGTINPVQNSTVQVNVTANFTNNTPISQCRVKMFNSTGSYASPQIEQAGTIQYSSPNWQCVKSYSFEYWRNAGAWNTTIYLNETGSKSGINSTNFTYNTLVSLSLNSSSMSCSGQSLNSYNLTNGYPVKIQNTGNAILNISLSGTNLVGQTNSSVFVGVGNVTYNRTAVTGTFANLSTASSWIFTSLPNGNMIERSIWFRTYYPGLKAQVYNGNTTIGYFGLS